MHRCTPTSYIADHLRILFYKRLLDIKLKMLFCPKVRNVIMCFNYMFRFRMRCVLAFIRFKKRDLTSDVFS